MPSTSRPTLKNLLRPFQRSQTLNLDHAESHLGGHVTCALDATTDVAESGLFLSHGPVYVKRIWFLPNAASTGHATDHRHIIVKDKGAAGDATTAVTTYATDTVAKGFVAFVPKTVYAPVSPGYYLPKGRALSIEITHGGGGFALNGRFLVEYTPVIA